MARICWRKTRKPLKTSHLIKEGIVINMKKEQLFKFIKSRRVAFISSIDKDGYPVMRAMLRPRKIEGNTVWFSTNTSSGKVAELTNNPKSCVYFYRKGLVRYVGVLLIGATEVMTDQSTKTLIWRRGDTIFYKGGVTDPDYCVLKFTIERGKVYCDLKTECFEI